MPAPRRSPTDAAEALVAVAPLATRWIERLLAGHDPALSVSQYLALRAIDREALTAAELARRTGVSGPAVSQLLAGLEDIDLIDRHATPGDRRHYALSLSSEGSRVYGSARRLLRRRVGALLADLPRPEIDALVRMLPGVEATLAGTPPPRRPPPPPRPPRRPPPPPRPPRGPAP